MADQTNILIVDSDAELSTALAQAFDVLGLGTVQTTTGEEALSAADKEPVDVALIDVDLPDMTGLELVRLLIKSQPQLVTILTDQSHKLENGHDALALGVARYLLKPFDGVSAVPKIIREVRNEREYRLRRLHSLSIIDAELEEGTATSDDAPYQVLLVEPLGAARGEITALLEEEGCHVTRAVCGQEALALLKSGTQELLITAQDMGDMMADDVIGRSQRLSPDVSAMVVSAEPTIESLAAFVRHGADDFIATPLEERERLSRSAVRLSMAARLRRSLESLDDLVKRAATYTIPPPPATAPEDEPRGAPHKATLEEREEATKVFEEGLGLFKEKDYDAAREKWNRAIELHPTNRWYRWNLHKLDKIVDNKGP